jgi:lipoprotein-anchoring transpeptidase ErfK/SrfK
VLLVVVVAGTSGGNQGDASEPATSPPAELSTQDTGLTVPAVTQANVVVDDTTPAVDKTHLTQSLTIGMYGDEVKRLQQRLTDLHFAPGPVDGQFGEGTQQAVWAFKKLIGGMSWVDLDRSGNATEVDDALWQQMQDPITVQPRRPQGPESVHVEIYLPLQVLVVFTNDEPTLISHVSSGELDENLQPKQWCEVVTYDTDANGEPLKEPKVSDECAYAKTPGGVFKVRRRYEGNRQGPLGGMYNPLYFNYGIAIHGAKNVPRHPASHGCIRINMDIAEYFPSLVPNKARVFVWGQDGKEPEQYSTKESLPSFNAPNPNSTSTTSSSTTAPATTTAETTKVTTAPTTPTATTKPPVATTTTTVKPAPTTTAAPTTLPPTTAAPVTEPPTTAATP